ncbi:hypothetical protein K8M07_12325 [Schnuerera sp. xch1]|uniref:hypothetical protein n=1 Tax=Schnuerera sp. xch1 TaxID=2874283 RepID=UPI001CBDEB4B|nr:hypothetical protein [Schnuerera sp. xch1]MBZ2176025.1 hypothetical protein [Schnuerera sp. xch1]
MKSNKFRKTVLTLGLGIALLGTTFVFSAPGAEDDPLVSLSYLDKRIEELESNIDKKLATIMDSTENEQTSSLEVVKISAGQSIIGQNGTEIILRGGKAKTIAGELGGLSDVTMGKDLKMDEQVPSNHLLIIPRDDGRGVHAIEDAIFMVRGKYEVR